MSPSSKRYYLVVAALDQQSTCCAMHLLRASPRNGMYTALKQLLLLEEELLFVKGSLSVKQFLVDSGSLKSLLTRTCNPAAAAHS
ncbi:hypothetical protein D4764_14G0003370 [Takifugu flavidus]|uniref:Uncharacterized protein n=1 Tax=Takifugu flavidus TaxID=433684 RepID=A0A5C6P5G6_9TELE|nr:hypothetical protein D4764_14G0003370 [Takifugu flavidus]